MYGYVSNLSITKSNRKYITYLINKRNVKMNYAVNALKDAYMNYLEVDKYPLAVLNIEVDNKLVDINVHPSKNEVRLSDEFQLCKLIRENVKRQLSETDIIKRVYNPKDYEQEEINFDYTPSVTVSPTNNDEEKDISNYQFNEYNNDIKSFESTYIEPKPEVDAKSVLKDSNIDPLFRIVGQIHKTYIIIETKDGFYIVDQHAAMERVNFERFSKLFSEEHIMIPLLIKKVIELNYKDVMFLKDKLDIFKEFGLELEVFGNNALRVNKVPTWMIHEDIETYVQSMIDQVLETKTVDIVKLRNHTIATVACKASLKANKSLNEQEMLELITKLFQCENPNTCPHGRPTLIFYSNYELEKLFKRVG